MDGFGRRAGYERLDPNPRRGLAGQTAPGAEPRWERAARALGSEIGERCLDGRMRTWRTVVRGRCERPLLPERVRAIDEPPQPGAEGGAAANEILASEGR